MSLFNLEFKKKSEHNDKGHWEDYILSSIGLVTYEINMVNIISIFFLKLSKEGQPLLFSPILDNRGRKSMTSLLRSGPPCAQSKKKASDCSALQKRMTVEKE